MDALGSLKRPRDATDLIVHEALQEDLKKKADKKRAKEGKPIRDKGKTLAEVENEEGGPVKESMVAMAHSKRAAKRKQDNQVGDADLVDDIEQAEEDLDPEAQVEAAQPGVDGDQGGTHGYTAFNLREERQRGYFDEEGNYVETGDKEEEEAHDAWLDSDGIKAVGADVLKKIRERQRQEDAEDANAPLSGRQIAELKGKLAALMQPRETIPKLLKRLGGNRQKPGQRQSSKKGAQQQQDAAAAAAEKARAAEARQLIDEVTECASALMMAGETDIYDDMKEEMERAAALYAPPPVVGGAAGADDDDDDDGDMFADESDDEADKPRGNAQPRQQQQQPQQPQAGNGAGPGHAAAGGDADSAGVREAPAAEAAAGEESGPGGKGPAQQQQQQQEEVDYGSWPVKELRRFLTERGKDPTGVVDKSELVAMVRAAAADGPDGAVPAGYTRDSASGYYYSPDTGLYYDATSGCYYNSRESKWYRWDAGQGQYVPAAE